MLRGYSRRLVNWAGIKRQEGEPPTDSAPTSDWGPEDFDRLDKLTLHSDANVERLRVFRNTLHVAMGLALAGFYPILQSEARWTVPFVVGFTGVFLAWLIVHWPTPGMSLTWDVTVRVVEREQIEKMLQERQAQLWNQINPLIRRKSRLVEAGLVSLVMQASGLIEGVISNG